MILRSRSDGVVIKRSVVQGIYYNAKDELMRIAALDHLWVRGGVRSQDADKVKVGQKLKVVFPDLGQTVDARVEYISRAIEPETQTARFRTSIPNPEGRFKAGMLVRVSLEVPPIAAQTPESHTARIKAPGSNIHERLENLKPKLDLLLKARADRTATTTFEAHLEHSSKNLSCSSERRRGSSQRRQESGMVSPLRHCPDDTVELTWGESREAVRPRTRSQLTSSSKSSTCMT